MPSDHPPSPQSPSQPSSNAIDSTHKLPTSPQGNSLPTPAHSINGSMSTLDIIAEAAYGDDLSNKRKRDLEDNGDREQKKVHLEDSEVSIKDLHLNVGPKYLLCKSPHPASNVPLRQDLYQLYGLEDIAKSVARENPDGTKGKNIRKSYKGIMKSLKLAGAFDADTKAVDAPDTLWAMVNPGFTDAKRAEGEDRWQSEFGAVAKAMSENLPIMAPQVLSKAVIMAKGSIPKHIWNPKVLGLETKKDAVTTPIGQVKTIQNSGARTPVHQAGSHQVGGAQRMAKAEPTRPQRNNAKRRYGDSVYEGYGEGYADDDMHDPGYSTGDGEDAMGGRKRPKKSYGNSQSPLGPRQTSYGPGSIGV